MVKDETSKTQPQGPNLNRRQLLKGLSSVPVVATLTPVSASALSIACTAPEKGVPDLPAGSTAYTQTIGSNTYTYQCLAPGTTGTPEAYPSVLVDDPIAGGTADTFVATRDIGSAAIGNHTDDLTGSTVTRQCVIYVDGGNNLTYRSDAAGTSPIGASCLISLGLS